MTGLAALALAVGIGVSAIATPAAAAAPVPSAPASAPAEAGSATTQRPSARTERVVPAWPLAEATEAPTPVRTVRPASAHPEQTAPRAPPADDGTAR
ncbi:hypothetical protein SAMN05421684_4337 [Asanoa ishikariensis]|uniref:Uncharacterized protein n=1 Tax=Asanoa ishikariensis TaxID=137265 RepID=A0A1H3RYU2_9ACTN|nr:hypothetical protein [Asanoa ishikariensis]SDZ30441.1 hypothetical protein SAMN05421684_4337 [Asanoa ishikariensis]